MLDDRTAVGRFCMFGAGLRKLLAAVMALVAVMVIAVAMLLAGVSAALEYDKVCLLDSDMLLQSNIEDVFLVQPRAAVMRGHDEFLPVMLLAAVMLLVGLRHGLRNE